MKLTVPDYIASISPYVPGKPMEELEREYGIRESVKLASNENPLGPSPKAMEAIREAVGNLNRYPDGSGYFLTQKLSEILGVPADHLILGNGSDDIIDMLARVFLRSGDEVIIPSPSFLMYEISVQATGAASVKTPLKNLAIDLDAVLDAVTPRTRLIFLCNPNNPTGTIFTRENFDRFMQQLPETILVVVDEAYIEFVRNPNCLRSLGYADFSRPVVTLRTFSKAYGLAGLRIGYGIASPEIISLLHRVRQPFNASLVAQTGALAALEDTEFLDRTLRTVHEGIDWLHAALDGMGIRYFPTESNFFLIDTGRDARQVFEELLREGVIVRSMAGYGFPRYIRVNTGTPAENRTFIEALGRVLG